MDPVSSMYPSLIPDQRTVNPEWQKKAQDTKARIEKISGESNAVRITDCLAACSFAFGAPAYAQSERKQAVADRAKQNVYQSQTVYIFNDPYGYDYMPRYAVRPIYYQPIYINSNNRTYNNYGNYGAPSMHASPVGYQKAGTDPESEKAKKKSEGNAVAVIAVITIAACFFGALYKAASAWIVPTYRNYSHTATIAAEYNGVARDLRKFEPQLEGRDTQPAQDVLGTMADKLQSLGKRARNADLCKLAGWTCLTTATVGTILAVITAIAAASLEAYVSVNATNLVLSTYAFCVATSSATMFVALGSIALVGGIFLLAASWNRQKNDESDREAGSRAMARLNTLLAPEQPTASAPSVPEPETSSGEGQNEGIPSETSSNATNDTVIQVEGQQQQPGMQTPSAPPADLLR